MREIINLETERLIIRNFCASDWEDLAELAIKYEKTELAKYDEGPWPSDTAEYKTIVKQMGEADNFLAVILKENRKLIGLIYKAPKDEKRIEFGFNFNIDYQGKGYATESCKKAIDYIFNILNIRVISAGTAKLNQPSNKLLKKLGFIKINDKIIAFRKDEEGNPIEFEAIDYSLKREDWLSQSY